MAELFAGRFELLDPIASGAMGEVWTARDHKDDSVVAVKLLRQTDAGGLLRFVREQGVRIHHPHVMTPLAWAGVDDRVLFSMPLATGGSVATLVGDYGPLPTRFVAELLRQLLAGLAAVHAAGVVHRDVKPANLLLDATGTGVPRLRLSDFGVAVPLSEPRLTNVAATIGTPGYMAPEQAGWADPHPAQDVYAAGMVGTEMLLGVRPSAKGAFDAALPAEADRGLWRLLTAMTEDSPSLRPSASEALAALQEPSLAWAPQDEIDVFPHLPVEGMTNPATVGTTRFRAEPPPSPATRSAASGRGRQAVDARHRNTSNAGPIALIMAGALVLTLVLVISSL